MNFTAREEYGLRAVIYLAANHSAAPIQSKEIARAEGIPEQFLEQVLVSLRRGGIVRSIRGASGGYELARPAREITAGDVFVALSGPIAPVQEQDGEQDRGENAKGCVVRELWQKVQAAVADVLGGTTIQDLVDERARRRQDNSYMMYI